MRNFLTKAVVSVMYSPRTWSLYKKAVWLMSLMFLFTGLLMLYANSLLLMHFAGMQLPNNIYSPVLLSVLAVLAASVTSLFSLRYKPEQKVMETYQKRS